MNRNQGSSDNQELQNPKQLKLKNQKMDIALRSKSRLIDNMAYQIRTLSNAIIGFSDLLATERLNDTQREYLFEIHQAGHGLSSIVEDVLDLAQIDSGKLKTVSVECDLADLLNEVELIVTRAARQKGLDFEIHAATDLPAHIVTDPNRLQKCLFSLAGNAVKFTQNGYVNILISLEFSQSQPMIRFDIVDTGSGIEPDRLKTIFEPVSHFDKVNCGLLDTINLGLRVCGGLAMTRRLVEMLGGRIDVVSEPQVGSTFSLIIPAKVDVQSQASLIYPPTTPISEMPQNVETQQPSQHLGHVLIVEDEESNRTVLSLMLESMGLQVTTCSDGEQAVQIAKDGGFDVILMDLQLPKLDGFQATRQLREMGLATPVLALSAGVLSEEEKAQANQYFDTFLAKPADSRSLSEALEKYLPTFKQDEQAEPQSSTPNSIAPEEKNDC